MNHVRNLPHATVRELNIGLNSPENRIIAIVLMCTWALCASVASQAADSDVHTGKRPWTTEDFYVAIEENDLPAVRNLLDDPNHYSKEFLSYYLLDHALELERTDIALLLVDAGAGFDTFSAVHFSNLPVLTKMLERGMEPKGASLAAAKGSVAMLKLLLKHGESDFSTVGAARYGHHETLNVLLEEGAEPEGLGWAVHNGHSEAIRLLLEAGANPNKWYRLWTTDGIPGKYLTQYLVPLQLAVLNKAVDHVELLLKFGADPNFSPNAATLLENSTWIQPGRYTRSHITIRPWPSILRVAKDPVWGDPSIAKLLEEQGAVEVVSYDLKSITPEIDLHVAANNRDYDEVVRLIRGGARPGGFGRFYYGFGEQYDPRIMQAVVEAGADPNAYKGDQAYSPAALALMNGDSENFVRLVKAGASLNIEAWRNWWTRLAANAPSEAIDLLWQSGVPREFNELVVALNYSNHNKVKLLLARGARPLWLSRPVENENLEIARMMLVAGADPNSVSDYDKNTPWEIAIESQNEEMIELLEEFGGKH